MHKSQTHAAICTMRCSQVSEQHGCTLFYLWVAPGCTGKDVRMSRRKAKPSRGAKVIAFKASPEADRDILTWWEALPEGQRSEALRLVIRAFLGGHIQVKPSQPKREIDPVTTQQIADDTAWIRASLMDLPSYLERLAERVSSVRPATTLTEASTGTAEPEQPRLEDEAVVRRRDKIGRNRW